MKKIMFCLIVVAIGLSLSTSCGAQNSVANAGRLYEYQINEIKDTAVSGEPTLVIDCDMLGEVQIIGHYRFVLPADSVRWFCLWDGETEGSMGIYDEKGNEIDGQTSTALSKAKHLDVGTFMRFTSQPALYAVLIRNQGDKIIYFKKQSKSK